MNVKGCKIVNIYQFKNFFNLKIRCRNRTYNLLLEPGKRIHFTDIQREWSATNQAMTLRKHIRNHSITNITQLKFDRIIIIEITGGYKIYLEVLTRGNLILTKDEKIIFSTKYVEMRDRKIKPGIKYQPPPGSPKIPLELNKNEFIQMLKRDNLVIKTLLKLGLGKKYAKEILHKLALNEDIEFSELDEEVLKKIFQEIKNLFERINSGKIVPIVYMSQGEPIDYSPFELSIYKEFSAKKFSTFSEALDYYYAYYEKTKQDEEIDKILAIKKKIDKKIEKQRALIKGYKEKAERFRKAGLKIYENISTINEIIEAVRKARKELNLSWDEIIEKIQEAKRQGDPRLQILDGIDNTGNIYLKLGDDVIVKMDISTNPNKLAETYFEKAKKFERKVKNAELELEKSLKEAKEITSIEIEKKAEEKVIIKEPQKKWYHQFHWFVTTDNLLVVAGKNAEGNEKLVKNYLDKNDIFLHAETHGAAATIIKEGRTKATQESLKEAAVFAASYSSAWKKGLTSIDVFWCHPEDVSLSPPSGMYLAKGSFIIKKKSYLKNVPLKLAIGVKIEKIEDAYTYQVLSGPPNAIKNSTELYVIIGPGNIKKSEMAKIIKTAIAKKIEKNSIHRKVLDSIKIEKFIDLLPGPSDILKGE